MQIGAGVALSFAINKISAGVAIGLFILYAVLTEFTFLSLF